jgi:hypothetical protein
MAPMLTVMEKAKIWEKEGFDVRDYKFSAEAIPAEEALFDDAIDFIFGNHVTPYWRLAQGHPMVCMAQTENWMHHWVAASPEITDLKQLNNKRVVGLPLFVNGKFPGHADGNRILLLELNGVDTKTVEFIFPNTVGNVVEAVRDGKAEACFITPGRNSAAAEAAGLRVFKMPPMPMVHSITFTTLQTRLQQHEDFAERLMRVMIDATHMIKTQKDQVVDMLKEPVVDWHPGGAERLAAHYDDFAAEYETKPYPRAEALVNVHKLACMVYPESRITNPLELWDTQTLRKLYDTGYVDKLYGGKQNVISDIHKVLNAGQCDDC